MDEVLRHLWLFAACTVVEEDLLSMVVDDILGRGQSGVLVRKSGSSGIKAALRIQLRGTQKKSVARYEPPFTKNLRSAGGRAGPIKSIHKL